MKHWQQLTLLTLPVPPSVIAHCTEFLLRSRTTLMSLVNQRASAQGQPHGCPRLRTQRQSGVCVLEAQ
jgi:hypothetical protein